MTIRDNDDSYISDRLLLTLFSCSSKYFGGILDIISCHAPSWSALIWIAIWYEYATSSWLNQWSRYRSTEEIRTIQKLFQCSYWPGSRGVLSRFLLPPQLNASIWLLIMFVMGRHGLVVSGNGIAVRSSLLASHLVIVYMNIQSDISLAEQCDPR